jgi:hypothetical protein
MFGKVKQWLGIEGVKLDIEFPDIIPEKAGLIEGKIRLQSMHTQLVTALRLKLVERYSRGRGENKLVDEYTIAEWSLVEEIKVIECQTVDIDFALPFKLVKSDVENFGSKNFLFKGIASLAHFSRNVLSQYRLEAEADVRGTALSPFARRDIIIKR